ncbi:MAG: hypothetical protein M1827_001344 [Pycnora praestabilis]|nr:MAG: hypothetical protein M1827_001344 [Pycnora praestabilis]
MAEETTQSRLQAISNQVSIYTSTKSSAMDFTTFHNIIDGKPRGAKHCHNGINPATKEKLWDVPIATKEDVNDAVEAAQRAFPSWSQTPFEERARLVTQFADAYAEHEKEFTDLMVEECGKPRQFAKAEVTVAVRFFKHHTALKLPEETFEDDEKIVTTRWIPLGVVGAICPWNFPIVLSVGKMAPALVAGDCIIVKPSPYTPYTALKVVEIAQSILPPGVLQVLGGDEKLGPWMVDHPGIQKISFTGSIATGKKIMEGCAKTLKRVTLELGGNDAAIVMPDVDIKKTAPSVALGAFFNSGQVCVATKRIYIHQDIYKPFVEEMVAFAKSMKVGQGNEKGVMMGPIQNEMQYEKVQAFFEDSKAKGYKFASGSQDVQTSKGYFIEPTIIDNPPNDSLIITEEPFGPIVPVQPWTSESEVIARANNTQTGLGACVWGRDVARAQHIGRQLEAGSVFINSFEKPTPQAFFSGQKQSGLGGEWGSQGLLSYAQAQVMHVYK